LHCAPFLCKAIVVTDKQLRCVLLPDVTGVRHAFWAMRAQPQPGLSTFYVLDQATLVGCGGLRTLSATYKVLLMPPEVFEEDAEIQAALASAGLGLGSSSMAGTHSEDIEHTA